MTLDVLWQDPRPGAVVEGGRSRRLGILSGLGDAARLHVFGRQSYIFRFIESLKIARRGGDVLVFYPDLPLFLPARAWKIDRKSVV